MHQFNKNGLGYILGDFFSNSSGHPGLRQPCESVYVALRSHVHLRKKDYFCRRSSSSCTAPVSNTISLSKYAYVPSCPEKWTSKGGWKLFGANLENWLVKFSFDAAFHETFPIRFVTDRAPKF
jgi:hypothetical protein